MSMYSWMAADTLSGAMQIVCYLATIVAAFVSMFLWPR